MDKRTHYRHSLHMILVFATILLFTHQSRLHGQEKDVIKLELFQEIEQLIEKAKAEEVNLLSPTNYGRAIEKYMQALNNYQKGEKIKTIQGNLAQAKENLNAGFQAAKISRVALEEILIMRKEVHGLKVESHAPKAFRQAEEQFLRVVKSAEKGDIRTAQSKFDAMKQRYKKMVSEALRKGVLKEAQKALEQYKRKINNRQYKNAKNEFKRIDRWIENSKSEDITVTDLSNTAIAEIDRVLEFLYPEFYKNLPDTLLMGDYTLYVISYESKGKYNFNDNVVTELSGLADFSYDCGSLLFIPIPGIGELLNWDFIVVQTVLDEEREISLSDAKKIDPSIKLGRQLSLKLQAESMARTDIVKAKNDLLESLVISKGEIRVRFEDITFEPTSTPGTGKIIAGSAYYPTPVPKPDIPAKIYVAGFTVHIDSLMLTPTNATAQARLELPHTVFDADICRPAMVDLGAVSITADCQLYKEMPDSTFGPWVVGNTGLVITGSGLTVDLSLTQSPSGMGLANDWRGVVLHSGNSIPEQSGTIVSNTGYIMAPYTFSNAKVIALGLETTFIHTGSYTFLPINPIGYSIEYGGGRLYVAGSKITKGRLESGEVAFPSISVCKAGNPGNRVSAKFDSLKIYEDLDLGGAVKFGSGEMIAWGELTHPGDESIVWEGEVQSGYLYLPAGPSTTFSPALDTSFIDFQFPWGLENIMTHLDTMGLTGVTLNGLENFNIFTPDVPGGTSNPITFQHNIHAWLRIGCLGLDGQCKIVEMNMQLELGNVARTGYEGNVPFDATLIDTKQMRGMLIQYAMSAVYDSEISGSVDIPNPCGLEGLKFSDMETSSTANLVGGDIMLPVSGDTLQYWQLYLVPTGDPEQAGVISVRTGRLVFTAAGISEPVHFAKPFGLTWGEIFADGNFGDLFFDYNDYGQRFDNIAYSPHHISLSKYIPGNKDGYLYTCGMVHINYFGPSTVNIHDARYDAKSGDPYYNRYVTIPKTPEDASCEVTDLHLHGEWHDALGGSLSFFDFPDITVDYHVDAQNGFLGKGTAGIEFIHSNGLDATVEIHGDTIAICMTSTTTHDLDFGLIASIGSIGQINGCVLIVGPLLKRISIDGYIEQAVSTGSGILAPKAGYFAEFLLSVTPNQATFATSGDMLFQFAGNAVDISGSVFLKVDFTKESAEGEINGKIDCNTTVAGLNGEGQITWYLSKSTQYLQGKVSVEVMSWGGGAGLEGGLFLGVNVPKAKAWVLQTGSEHFGVSDAILPSSLTGLYGYGQLSFSVQWYIFGGGIEIYAGIGAFTGITGSGVGSIITDSDPLMIIGSVGVYVHGEILGGLVSASAWGDLDLRVGALGLYFEGTFGLEGCVLWVICASVDVTAGLSPQDGFYLH